MQYPLLPHGGIRDMISVHIAAVPVNTINHCGFYKALWRPQHKLQSNGNAIDSLDRSFMSPNLYNVFIT